MRAVGVDEPRLARRGAVEHDVAPEVVERSHLARVEVGAGGDDEPPVRHREREAPTGPSRDVDPPRRVGDHRRVAGHGQPDREPLGLFGRVRGVRPHQISDLAHTISCSGVSPWMSSTNGPMRSISGRQRADVDAVELGRVQAEDALALGPREVLEPQPDPLPRVREGAFGMGEVVPPQQVADADLVAAGDVLDARGGRGEEAVAVDVLARLHGQVLAEHVAELLGVVAAHELLVHLGHDVGQPPRTVLGDDVLEAGMALEHARTTAAPTAGGPPTSTPRSRRSP